MCGMGRTGKWFGLDHYGIAPDMITLGKGLNGGYAALSAVGCQKAHLNDLREKAGNFIHGHTFSHHAVAAAAALSVVEILEREKIVERAQLGCYLEQRLAPLADHPHVGQIRGLGLMDLGIILYKCVGFANGDGDAIMLGPPFIISESELDMAIDAIEQVLTSAGFFRPSGRQKSL